MTKAIIDIAGPLGIFVPDYIMVRKNGTPARRAEADLGWRHRSIEARRPAGLVRACCLAPQGIYEERNALPRYLWQIWTPAA
jgi:hypothetical protein